MLHTKLRLILVSEFICIIILLKTSFAQDTWTATSTGTNCPSGRRYHSAVWSGTKMIVWGGLDTNSTYTNTGGVYDPSTDIWTLTSTGTNCPSPRGTSAAIWDGSKMIVWGGGRGGAAFNSGGIYDPTADTWAATDTGTNCPSPRFGPTAIWTGSKMVIWGGDDVNGVALNTGGVYDPSNDTWTPTSTTNAPAARYFHTAIWTGSKMIVWGGYSSISLVDFKTGGVYDPVLNTWTATDTGTNCPSSRERHTAVWTGSKMIIWAGYYNATQLTLNTGGIYDPSTNGWTVTSTGTNCPNSRVWHTAVWTGTKMIVWGGAHSGSGLVNTGGVYDPLSNGWTATTTTNAPEAREFQTAVWSDFNGMIVWAGVNTGGSEIKTGGIYRNDSLIGIKSANNYTPSEYKLFQNYPNPFNPSTKIKFDIAPSPAGEGRGEVVKLIIYDILGHKVASLVNENLQPRTYEVEWDGSNYPSGAYFYRLIVSGAEPYTETKKMVLMK